jgi:adenosylcobinamide-phosphate synthase
LSLIFPPVDRGGVPIEIAAAMTPPSLNDPLLLLLAGLAIDAVFGDMRMVFRFVPHPVVLAGRAIAHFERKLNRPQRSERARRERGILTVIALVGAAAALGWIIQALCRGRPVGVLIEALLIGILLAQRSLFLHVAAVAMALRNGGLEAGRKEVSHIVGMIGHRSERYRAFGWAAARFDDLANLVPARLGGLLLATAALFVKEAHPGRSLVTMLRDAGKHRSPNAGWPEAAMAGALDLALAGPRHYADGVVNDPWIGSGTARATSSDIFRALRLYHAACLLLSGGLVVAWIALHVRLSG